MEDPELHAFARSLVRGAEEGAREGAGAVAIAIERGGRPRRAAWAGRTVSFTADGAPLATVDTADAPEGAGTRDATEAAPKLSQPIGRGSLFDLASATKLVTALTAAVLADEGALALDAPVAPLLPSGAVPDTRITARHLLTHTSGLPPTAPLWRLTGGRDDRLDAIGTLELAAPPGTAHAYSCIGFLVLGRLLESIGGAPLPELAHRLVLEPAGARTATWSVPPERRGDAAATEYEDDPDRGLVQGEVHDETAWAIGGAGNAGLFATADDALAIGRVLAGTAPGPSLSPAIRAQIASDQLTCGASTGAPWRQGLGVRIGQELPGGAVVDDVIGHPGFTGTSIWAQPSSGTVAVLLTNRVHPRRDRFEIAGARREAARMVFAPDVHTR